MKCLDMGMQDPVPTFSALVSRIKERHPKFAYIHVVEPDAEVEAVDGVAQSNDFISDIWLPRPLIRTNGYERETAITAAKTDKVLVGFARNYLANVCISLLSRRIRPGLFWPPARSCSEAKEKYLT